MFRGSWRNYRKKWSGSEPVSENCYKLLTDFTVYDNGEYAPQEGVKMIFPTEDDAFGSMASLIKRGLEEDAALEAKRSEEVPAIVREIMSGEHWSEKYAERNDVKGDAQETGKRYSLTDPIDNDTLSKKGWGNNAARNGDQSNNRKSETLRMADDAGGRGRSKGASVGRGFSLSDTARRKIEEIIAFALDKTEIGRNKLILGGVSQTVEDILSVALVSSEYDRLQRKPDRST